MNNEVSLELLGILRALDIYFGLVSHPKKSITFMS